MSFCARVRPGQGLGVRVGGLRGLDDVSGLFIWLLYLPILFFVI